MVPCVTDVSGGGHGREGRGPFHLQSTAVQGALGEGITSNSEARLDLDQSQNHKLGPPFQEKEAIFRTQLKAWLVLSKGEELRI